MSPDARGVMLPHVPGAIVYLPSAPSVFHLEPRRRTKIERQHVVVGMSPERRGDLDPAVLREVHRRAHVIDRAGLDHEVEQSLRQWQGNQGEGMMARVAVQKRHCETHRPYLHLDKVADPEAQQIAIEPDASLDVFGRDHDMPQPLVSGLEAGNRARRMERPLEFNRWTVERLARDTIGIGETNQFRDPARRGHLARSRLDLDSAGAQPLGNRAERGRIRHLPSRICDIVAVVAMEREAAGVLIHPKPQYAILADPGALKPQHFGCELLPRFEVFDAQSEIAEAAHRAHSGRPPWTSCKPERIWGRLCASSVWRSARVKEGVIRPYRESPSFEIHEDLARLDLDGVGLQGNRGRRGEHLSGADAEAGLMKRANHLVAFDIALGE